MIDGSIASITVLLGAFAFFFLRSLAAHATAERLARENERLLATSRQEALTDALTGLPNRRALVNDLTVLFAPIGSRERPTSSGSSTSTASSSSTTRSATRPATRSSPGSASGCPTPWPAARRPTAWEATSSASSCPSVTTTRSRRSDLAAKALSEASDGVVVECSYGTAAIPAEAETMEQALRLVDHRLYDRKTGRSSASRQSTDVLVQVLRERGADLHGHLIEVAQLAAATARAMRVPHHEVKRIELAAELHDVGQTAIPDTILTKPGPLDAAEREVMRRHPQIGERIVRAAPSLARTADLVRASHERYDGQGYPDRLPGQAIPLGARIIGGVRRLREDGDRPALSAGDVVSRGAGRAAPRGREPVRPGGGQRRVRPRRALRPARRRRPDGPSHSSGVFR